MYIYIYIYIYIYRHLNLYIYNLQSSYETSKQNKKEGICPEVFCKNGALSNFAKFI